VSGEVLRIFAENGQPVEYGSRCSDSTQPETVAGPTRLCSRKFLSPTAGKSPCGSSAPARSWGLHRGGVFRGRRNALHVRFADEAVWHRPGAQPESYLNIPQVISAAEITKR